MERARNNLPFIIFMALPVAAASIYLLFQPNPILAIAPPLLLPVLLWLGYHPIHIYYLIVALIPFNAWRELMSQYKFLTLSKLLGVFLIGILLLRLVADPPLFRRAFSRIWILLGGFFALSMISTFYSDHFPECVDQMRMLMIAYLFFGFTLFFIREKELKIDIPFILAVSTSIAALVALSGYVFRIDALMLTTDPEIASGRAVGSASNPNLMAATLLVGIPFMVYFFFQTKSAFSRIFWLLLFFINSSAIALSYSRSMLLAYTILITILVIDNFRQFRVRYAGFVSVLVSVVLIYAAVKIPETAIWERMTTLSAPQTDVSLMRRASYVLVAKDAVKKNPFIGTGPGTFPFIYQYSTFASAFAKDPSGYARSAHNTYLEVVVGTGILGLGIFIAIIASAFVRLYRIHKRIKDDDVVLAALVRSIAWAFIAFLTALMFSSQLYHKYVWMLLGLSFVVGRVVAPRVIAPKGDPTGL